MTVQMRTPTPARTDFRSLVIGQVCHYGGLAVFGANEVSLPASRRFPSLLPQIVRSFRNINSRALAEWLSDVDNAGWAAPTGLDTGLQVVRQEKRSSLKGCECVDSKIRVKVHEFRVSEGHCG